MKRRRESEIAKLPTVIHGVRGTLRDRETIIGVVSNGEARAYPMTKVTAQSPELLDVVGKQPIMLVAGPDGKSVRVFSRQIAEQSLEFYGHGAANPNDSWELVDAGTLSEWGFDCCAVSGEMNGQCLAQLYALKDFWFDWQHYHPGSGIYRH